MLLSFSAMSLFAETQTAKDAKSALPTLTYYYYDGWPLCNKITVIVNDLKKDYDKTLNIKTLKVGAPGSAEAIKEAKLTNHGIIGRDINGKIVATVDGHKYKKDKVLEAVKKILAAKK